MDINKRNRTDLKSYFVKNSIPTESNFAELIDGMLNQKDDGIVKLPDNPLSIQASGDAAGLQKVINFYQNFNDPNPAWMLNLNPRSDPNKPETAKAGFSISDGQGNSRLFIDFKSGNIGIGTIDPSIAGMTRSLALGRSANGIYGIVQREVVPWRMSLVTEGQERLSIKDNGNVGIGVPDPQTKLDVKGDAAISGNAGITGALGFGAQVRQMINLWSSNYGIGVQNNTQYFRTDKNFAWYKAGSHNDGELNPGGGTIQMIIKDGNIGIGTIDPSIAGMTRSLALGRGSNGIYGIIQREIGPWRMSIVTEGQERLSIKDNGNVGIGIADSQAKLQLINAAQDANGNTLTLGPTDAANLRLGYHTNYTWIQSHGSKPLLINSIGNNVGIGTTDPKATLTVNGDFQVRTTIGVLLAMQNDGNLVIYRSNGTAWWASGTSVSDSRLKKDIRSIEHPLEKLLSINGISFSWTEEEWGLERELGVLADEVEKVFPELVCSLDKKYKSVKYQGLFAVLIEAIKEQQAEIFEFSKEIQALKGMLKLKPA